ncbi:MAG: DUF5060 domain-containing protein [Pirellulales bacterium]|nr:DUF5060 domain-containing protein [Pirellulales bacterium]
MRTTTLKWLCLCAGLLAMGTRSQADSAERQIGLSVGTPEVGKYERVEFTIDAPTSYRNPFDPDEVDLTLVLKAPDGTALSIPAFYCQLYERRQIRGGRGTTDWMAPAGPPVWKARFAPGRLGVYTATARLKDGRGTAESESVRFEATPSRRAGFLRVSRRDPRFLEFSEGQPFFAIGQNLAFIGAGQQINLSKAEEVFAKLSQNGANYLRIWTCCEDWAMAIEARKSAWGRSWNWKPPWVAMPGNENDPAGLKCVRLAGPDGATLSVSPSHDVAVRPNTRYVVSGKVRTDATAKLRVELGGGPGESYASDPVDQWTAFRQEFVTGPDQMWLGRMILRLDGAGEVLLDALSLKEAGGGELLWEAEVNRTLRGFYNPPDCFMLDELLEAAEAHGIYLQLCLITRDLYMKSLKDPGSEEYRQATDDAKKLLRYAVARWGYSTSVAAWEYFNEIDPGLPTDRFYATLGEYLERIDVYGHLRTTSTWHPSPKDWRHPKLDMAQMHHYLRPVPDAEWKDGVAVMVDKTRMMRENTPAGPMMVGEFGLAGTKWERSDYMKQDRELVHFHNALWASALSGASGTALFWWWEQLEAQECYHHYRPLADFLADVPFTTAGLQPTSATVSARPVRVLGLQGNDCAYVWLFNPEAAWWNLVVQKATPAAIESATIEVPTLAPGPYQVTWWDTLRGAVLKQQDVSVAPRQVLRLAVPAFSRDIAGKIVRSPEKR